MTLISLWCVFFWCSNLPPWPSYLFCQVLEVFTHVSKNWVPPQLLSLALECCPALSLYLGTAHIQFLVNRGWVHRHSSFTSIIEKTEGSVEHQCPPPHLPHTPTEQDDPLAVVSQSCLSLGWVLLPSLPYQCCC